MAAFDRLVTIYGGGAEGTRWQVKLSKGSYYVFDIKTNNTDPYQGQG